MAHRRRARRPEAALDAATLFSSDVRSRNDHKDQQAARIAERALYFALAEDPEELLGELQLFEVTPDPTAARLRVSLLVTTRVRGDAALDALERARGRLRAAVADALQRKKAPVLAFELVPAPAEDEVGAPTDPDESARAEVER
ncbi:hypothetical protein L6R52_09285 [Myxococcota bacterium]|nr:hypothetical protein [Myxococcota bacterium]